MISNGPRRCPACSCRPTRCGRRASSRTAPTSVGVLGALNRVYLNIGLFSEEWLLHFRPLVGGKRITPIEIADADKNSSYWQATTRSDARHGAVLPQDRAAGPPHGHAGRQGPPARPTRPSSTAARSCSPKTARAAIRASSRPICACTGQPCTSGQIVENTETEYFRWMRPEVDETRLPRPTTSCRPIAASRSPEIGINACSPLGTNAIRNNIWDNFSSETYKTLPAVGEITVLQSDRRHAVALRRCPAADAAMCGRHRCVSVWSTAPFLQNNSVGPFNPDPVGRRAGCTPSTNRSSRCCGRNGAKGRRSSATGSPGRATSSARRHAAISRCRPATCRGELIP